MRFPRDAWSVTVLKFGTLPKKLQPFAFGHLHILTLCGTEEMYAMNPRARRRNIRLEIPMNSYRSLRDDRAPTPAHCHVDIADVAGAAKQTLTTSRVRDVITAGDKFETHCPSMGETAEVKKARCGKDS